MEAFMLRNEMLEKLQKENKISGKNCKELKPEERELLAQVCHEADEHRDFSHNTYEFIPENQHKCPDVCKLKEIYALGIQFLAACSEGDFKTAEHLLSQRKNYRSIT